MLVFALEVVGTDPILSLGVVDVSALLACHA